MESNDLKLFYYVVYPGNNPTSIENALKKRNIWRQLSPDKSHINAHILWKNLNFSPKMYSEAEQQLKYNPSRQLLLNHFEQNQVICSKSGLLKSLKYYYSHGMALSDHSRHIHEVIPTSFILHAHKDDTQFKDFREKFTQIEKNNYNREKVPEKHCEKNAWFIKPESDNQGKGIILSNNIKQIESFLVTKPVNSGWIVQKAIQKPLLYHGRKFDIRVWVLVTPQLQIYYYNEPYIRTSSSTYTTENMSTQIHLTNNTKQKQSSQYSKFQEGNTLPLKQVISKYIKLLDKPDSLMDSIITKMKEFIVQSLMSARKNFNRGAKKKQFQFQLFGYDFLLDQDFRVWLLEVNNNPYLGTPNAFIKELLPLMIDQMMQIIIDPIFPPVGYTPVQQKRFELLNKQTSLFRLQPVRMVHTSTDKLVLRKNSFSRNKPIALEHSFPIDPYKEIKSPKTLYSTPSQTIKYLLDNYCFNDLDPFINPVYLLLSSSSLQDQSQLQQNIKKIKMISQTRVAKILLQKKIFDLVSNIVSQQKYPQKIKAQIIMGVVNSSKSFKAKMFILKHLIPLMSQSIKTNFNRMESQLLESVVRLLITVGAYFNRTVFIPGQSRQNQFVRDLFIRSNSLKLLLFLNKKHPTVCQQEIAKFLSNFSEKDWQLFYECSGNKSKRCYSPKVNTAPDHEQELIVINSSVLQNQKPRIISVRQSTDMKNFRARRNSSHFPK